MLRSVIRRSPPALSWRPQHHQHHHPLLQAVTILPPFADSFGQRSETRRRVQDARLFFLPTPLLLVGGNARGFTTNSSPREPREPRGPSERREPRESRDRGRDSRDRDRGDQPRKPIHRKRFEHVPQRPPREQRQRQQQQRERIAERGGEWRAQPQRARTEAFVNKRPSPLSALADKSAASKKPLAISYTKASSGDVTDWRAAVEELERTLHVHGNNGKYTPGDVYAIMKACVANGRFREAQSVVRKAQSVGIAPSAATQAQMCALHARKGNVDLAFEQLTETLRAATSSTDAMTKSSIDARLFDPLLSVLKTQHDWQNIRRAVQLMHEYKIEPPMRVFRVLMIAAAKARKKDVLLKTVDFLNTRAGDTPVDEATLTAMCQALTEVGETRKVMDLYHEMDQDWLVANGGTILFNNFVLAALKHGRMYKAVEIFERMKISEKCPPDDFTFAVCILEFEKRGEWAQVIRFFNEMQDRELKGISQQHAINALSCAAVVRALHKQRDNDDGAAVSKKDMERDMQVVLQRLDRVEIQQFGHSASLVDVLEEYGYHKHAQQLFQRMVDNSVISTPWLRADGFEIDLHSFSRGLAKCAVVYAFQQIRTHAPVRKIDDMRIITGVGKRSKQFLQPVVPAEVSQLLIRSFRPLIRPMPHPTNPGVLLIRRKIIQEWLDNSGSVRYFE